jgi:hypothetical protein
MPWSNELPDISRIMFALSKRSEWRCNSEMKSLYCLFAVTLNHLCHIGSAYGNDPMLEL